MKGNFESCFLGKEWSWSYDNVYKKPDIPRAKLMNALSYAARVQPEDVLLLIDDTAFGGARDGVLLTSDAIYCHELFCIPKRVSLSDIQEIGMAAKGQVTVNNIPFFKCTLVGHLALLTITSCIESVLNELREDKESMHQNSNIHNKKSDVSVTVNRRYKLNLISRDRFFEKIKKFRNLNRVATVAGLLLAGGGDGNASQPLIKITEEFVRLLHKSVFEFRKVIVEGKACGQLANDYSTIEVICYTAMQMLKNLHEYNPPHAVFSALMSKGITDCIFSDSDETKKILAAILGIYFKEEGEGGEGGAFLAFCARLYVTNQERRLIIDQSSVFSSIWDAEAGYICSQFEDFSDDFEYQLKAFDRVVQKLSGDFSIFVCNIIMRR